MAAMAVPICLGTPVTVGSLGTTGVVRTVDVAAGISLVQLKDGTTTWAFTGDCERMRPVAGSTTSAPAVSLARPAREASAGAQAKGGQASKVTMYQPQGGHDESAVAGLSVGTLRWKPGHKWQPLGKPRWLSPPTSELCGWGSYLLERLPESPDGQVRVDGSLLDGACYPLSLAFALRELERAAPEHALRPPSLGLGTPLTCVVIGASVKVEERLLYESDYWLELAHLFPEWHGVELILVGLEVSEERHGDKRVWSPRLRSECWRGSARALLAKRRLDPTCTVIAGFNTGCGAGIPDLSWSWAPELSDFVDREYLCAFFAANDYSDLKGELMLLGRLIGARFVLDARENPFAAATIVKEPGDGHVEWSRSCALAYAFRGATGDEGAAQVRMAMRRKPAIVEPVVRKLAEHHKRTQEPTPPP